MKYQEIPWSSIVNGDLNPSNLEKNKMSTISFKLSVSLKIRESLSSIQDDQVKYNMSPKKTERHLSSLEL
jgi:hypothetical protein